MGDLGAAISSALLLIGDELGLYRELANGPMSAAEPANRTGMHERYVREWLGNQAAGCYAAGERRLREVMTNGGGFSRFRRATESPFNMVFEARP